MSSPTHAAGPSGAGPSSVLSMDPKNVKLREGNRAKHRALQDDKDAVTTKWLKENYVDPALQHHKERNARVASWPREMDMATFREKAKELVDWEAASRNELPIDPRAVEAVVTPTNFRALIAIARTPMGSDLSRWPEVFKANCSATGRLYIREGARLSRADMAASIGTLPENFDPAMRACLEAQVRAEDAPEMGLKYGGITLASSPEGRYAADEKRKSGRFAKLNEHIRLAGNKGEGKAYALVGVTLPCASPVDLRKNTLAQDMERFLVLLGGSAFANFASGGFHYRFQPSDELRQAVKLDLDSLPAPATALDRPPPQGPAKAVRAHLEEVRRTVRDQPVTQTGAHISDASFNSCIKMATNSGSCSSLVLLREVTREACSDTTGQLSFFGAAAGRGPTLERDLCALLADLLSDADGHDPSALRAYIDMYPCCSSQELVFLHTLHVLRMLLITKPHIVRAQSAEVCMLLLTHGLHPPGLQSMLDRLQGQGVAEHEILATPLSELYDRTVPKDVGWRSDAKGASTDWPGGFEKITCQPVLSELRFGGQVIFSTVVIPVPHVGLEKYDPALAPLRASLFLSSAALQRAAELLLAAQPTLTASALLPQLDNATTAIQSAAQTIRNRLVALGGALTSSRMPRGEMGQEKSELMSAIVQAAHERRFKAPAPEMWDEIFLNEALTKSIPAPHDVEPGSEDHKAFLRSLKEGVDVQLAAQSSDWAGTKKGKFSGTKFDVDNWAQSKQNAVEGQRKRKERDGGVANPPRTLQRDIDEPTGRQSDLSLAQRRQIRDTYVSEEIGLGPKNIGGKPGPTLLLAQQWAEGFGLDVDKMYTKIRKWAKKDVDYSLAKKASSQAGAAGSSGAGPSQTSQKPSPKPS